MASLYRYLEEFSKTQHNVIDARRIALTFGNISKLPKERAIEHYRTIMYLILYHASKEQYLKFPPYNITVQSGSVVIYVELLPVSLQYILSAYVSLFSS